jgi:large subunit ribosomal protein L4
VFGPKPRDYSFRIPRKVRKLAFLSALSAAAKDERITVMEDFALDVPSTRTCADILGRLKLDGRVMVVVADDDLNVEKSFRNLANVETYFPNELNTYDLLRFDSLVFLQGALGQLQGGGGDEAPA